MLKPVIEHIDCQLDIFTKQYGLAERVSEVSENDPKTFPAVYKGKEEYNPINFENQCSYHRINGNRTFEPTSDNFSGCSKGVQINIPMFLVGCVKLAEYSQYEFEEVSNRIASSLMSIQFPKLVRRAIQAHSIELQVTTINSDRTQVWSAEHENMDMAVPFGYTLFSIGYTLLIKADSSCLITKC